MTGLNTDRIVCPLCGEHIHISSHFSHGASRIRKCDACSVAFVYPRLSGHKLLVQYSQDYFHEKYDSLRESHYVNMESWQNKIVTCFKRIDRLSSAKTGLLLDIGCGKGWFLKAARDRGWRVQGVELCAEVACQASECLETHVQVGSIFDVVLPSETFDVVTLFDVIEHLEEPVEALRICHRILKPRGVLALSTPNLNGLGCRLLGARAFAVWPDEHIFYFTPTSIRHAMMLAGFTRFQIASREIYPENAALLLSLVFGGYDSNRGIVKPSESAVRSIKKSFRHSFILKGIRATMNRFFSNCPLGDELLAFAVK